VHRDLKPDNLMLVPDSFVPGGVRVKILDFGLAKILNDNAKPTSIDTQVGIGLGTVDYIAPEQILDARNANDRADVYSLGCILFELAAGRKPFLGEDTVQILGAHLTRPAPDLLEIAAGLPRQLAALLAAMLSKEPQERPTMRQVVRWLDEVWRAWIRQGSDTIIIQPGAVFSNPMNRSAPSSQRPRPASARLRRALPLMAVSATVACLPWVVMLQSCLPRLQPALSQPLKRDTGQDSNSQGLSETSSERFEESLPKATPTPHVSVSSSNGSVSRTSLANAAGLVLR
jgi:serine/threonine-protein kinase